MLWTTSLHIIQGLIWMTLKVNCDIYTKYKVQTSYADKLCTAFVEQTLISFTSYSCLATCSHIAKCGATIYHRNSQLCYILRSGYQNEDCPIGLLGAQFFSKAMTCPEGWKFLFRSCFRITEDELGWSASLAACKRFNTHSHLAYVKTMEENKKLQQWILNDVEGDFRLWLGAKHYHDKWWKWSDGTYFVVSNWAPAEPDLDDFENMDNCLHIYNSDFDFGDKLCEHIRWVYRGLCELNMF